MNIKRSNLIDKKKIIVVAVFALIALVITQLYYTYATSSTLANNDNIYDITLTDSDTLAVPAKSSKTVYYQLCNTNKGKVKYGVGYTTNNADIIVKGYWDSPDSLTGIIDYGENKFIKLKISNYSASDEEVTLNTVLGYEKGGELPSVAGVTMITETLSEYYTLMAENESILEEDAPTFLKSDLVRENISSITFVDDNIVPENMTSADVSLAQDKSIMLWYEESNYTDYLDVYIGSESGKISLSSGRLLFAFLINLNYLNLSNINTSNVTDMKEMFYYAGFISSTSEVIGLDYWDTSNVIDMSEMFTGAGMYVTTFELDLSGWDTSSVTDMSHMFDGVASNATTFELDLSGWDTSSVTDMSHMFDGVARNATTFELDLSGWDTSSVTDMSYMFYEAGYSATTFELYLSNWNTSSVTDMRSMFCDAGYSATTWSIGDLSGWDTSSVTDMRSMFSNAGLYATNWSLDLSTKTVTRDDGTTYTAWDVSKVTDHTGFNTGVESKITAPTWVS